MVYPGAGRLFLMRLLRAGILILSLASSAWGRDRHHDRSLLLIPPAQRPASSRAVHRGCRLVPQRGSAPGATDCQGSTFVSSALSLRGGGGLSSRARTSASSSFSAKRAASLQRPKKPKRGGADPSGQSGKSKASMSASVFNLVNNVAGAGILALSAGQATGTGWVPSVLMCAALGALSAHSFAIVGSACEELHQQDFKGLWAATLGADTTWVVDTFIAVLCLACAVIYSGILGDVFTQLLSQSQILPPGWNTRGGNIVVITALALLPMSLIKNLSALAFTSVLGFTAIMYTVFFIAVRALDGSYKPGAKFVTDGVLKLLPKFDKASLWNVDFSSLVLASNLGLAYVAHYNAPSFYRELEDASARRFRRMVNASFALLVLLYVVTMVSGYSTFGDVCQGNILLNYHPDDWLATLGRLATGFSILFGFPLVATGARESLIGAASSLGRPVLGTDHWHVPLVVAILTVVTTISLTVSDVSLVVGLTGAALGSFIVYICPAVLYAKAIEMSRGHDSPDYKMARWNLLMVPFGLFTGALGAYMTVQEKLKG